MPGHAYVLGLKVDLAIERNDWETAMDACQQLAALHSPTTRYPDGYTCLASVALFQEDEEQAAEHQAQAEEIAWKDRLDVSLCACGFSTTPKSARKAGLWHRSGSTPVPTASRPHG